MGKILIIDDDIAFSRLLKEKLQNHFEEEIIVFNKVDEEYLDTNVLDLLFLDIEMGEINGIEVARRLKNRPDVPIIIFVSNKEVLIHSTLEVQPFYFVRKDFLDVDLNSAFSLLRTNRFRIRTTVQVQGDIIDVNEVIYIESNNHDVILFTKSGRTKRYRMTLSNITKIFGPYAFARVQRSFTINMRYVVRWHSEHIVLKDGIKLDIGNAYCTNAKKKYQEAKLDGII